MDAQKERETYRVRDRKRQRDRETERRDIVKSKEWLERQKAIQFLFLLLLCSASSLLLSCSSMISDNRFVIEGLERKSEEEEGKGEGAEGDRD